MRHETILEMKHIEKSFPGVRALDGVDFSLRKGEVHAVLGENGAGKSTLMKILSGMYRADVGEIRIDGSPARINSPNEALRYGIAMVYQNFTLSPELTVWENIVLGSCIPFFVKPDQLKKKIMGIIDAYGLQIDLNAKAWQLSVGEQQRVEIIKCFYRGANILILDEPTSVLTPPEAEELFSMIERIVERGCTVVFISHKLNEVLRLADYITVFCKGKKVCEMEAQGCTPQSLSHAMVGHDVMLEDVCEPCEPGPAALDVRDLYVRNDKNLPALQGVSLTLHAGEILGIAAVSGNGQAELAEAITGLRPVDAGSILLPDGREVHRMSVRAIIDAGISHISEKRLDRSLIPAFSVAENLVLKEYNRPPYSRRSLLREKDIRRNGQAMIDRFGIASPSPATSVRSLSGGNLQKVALAREISRSPRILLAVNPTYGLDIGTIEFVQKQLAELRRKGTAILLVSEELDEVLRLSDRVAVMSKGKIVGMFRREECSRDAIGLLMTRGGACDES